MRLCKPLDACMYIMRKQKAPNDKRKHIHRVYIEKCYCSINNNKGGWGCRQGEIKIYICTDLL